MCHLAALQSFREKGSYLCMLVCPKDFGLRHFLPVSERHANANAQGARHVLIKGFPRAQGSTGGNEG